MTRALLATLALVRLGVPADQAHDLVWYALDEDPELGVERVLLRVRTRCRELSQAAEITDARETIDALSERCAALEAYVRGMERDAVEVIRVRRA